MQLEKAWMTFSIATFLCQVASLMLNASIFISILVLGLFIVGCGLCFATLFNLIHRFTTSTRMRVPSSSVLKEVAIIPKPETSLKVPDNMKVTADTEESEWRAKLEDALLREGGE